MRYWWSILQEGGKAGARLPGTGKSGSTSKWFWGAAVKMNIQQCWNSSTEIPGASPTKAAEEAGECWFSVLLRYFCCFCAQSHTAFVSVSSPLWLTSEESSEPVYIFPLSRISATYLFFTVDFLRFIFLQCILGCVFGFQLLCNI